MYLLQMKLVLNWFGAAVQVLLDPALLSSQLVFSHRYSGPIVADPGPRLQLPAKVAGHEEGALEHEAARDNCAMFMSATLGWGTPRTHGTPLTRHSGW